MADEGTEVTKETDAYDAEAVTSLHVRNRRSITSSWHTLLPIMELESVVTRFRAELISLIISVKIRDAHTQSCQNASHTWVRKNGGGDCLLKRIAGCDRVPNSRMHKCRRKITAEQIRSEIVYESMFFARRQAWTWNASLPALAK